MVDWSGLSLSFSRFSPDFDANAQGAEALLMHTIKVQFPDVHEQFRNVKALTIMASTLGEVLDIEAEDLYIKRPAGPMVTLEARAAGKRPNRALEKERSSFKEGLPNSNGIPSAPSSPQLPVQPSEGGNPDFGGSAQVASSRIPDSKGLRDHEMADLPEATTCPKSELHLEKEQGAACSPTAIIKAPLDL
ncbi:unnamed protein product [Sphagnum troendelagicum]|uniref:Uncharacterized protein n=1 Tax=Sphagnum troendelagicum TaxID=128251 RepID=A0ABP0TKV5_9BRYO